MTAPELTPDEAELRRLAETALAEDRADQDVTTAALVPEDQTGRGLIIAKAEGILAGLPIARAVFAAAAASLAWKPSLEDGHRLSSGDRVVTIEGSLSSILRAERVALNYLTHLSGIATATAAVVRALEGTGCRLRDTRKTIPACAPWRSTPSVSAAAQTTVPTSPRASSSRTTTSPPSAIVTSATPTPSASPARLTPA